MAQRQRKKSTGKSSKSVKKIQKKHGVLLIGFLVFMIIHGIVTAVMYDQFRTPDAMISRPYIAGLMVLHSLLNIAAAAGIWFWKKWGLYLYAGSTILALVLGLITVGMWSVFSIVLPAAILGWILTDKWEYFES